MLNTGKLAGKTLYITGASRGIGKAIALKAAQDGAKVVVAAKTAEPHPKLPGTIFTAAKEIESAGGAALPCVVDVRSEESVQESIENAVRQFGGIDIVVNNASAISLTGTEETSMKKFDLMHQINSRGTYLVSKLAMPYLRASKMNPQVLNISPPLNMSPRWFKNHAAYTMAKYGMSMCVLGMAEEFKAQGIAVNALWPKTAIITAAMEMLGGKDVSAECRLPDIMADAAYVILTRDSRSFTGNFVIDEDILREEGLSDMDRYAAVPGTKTFIPDFFLDEFDEYEARNKAKALPRFKDGKDTHNEKSVQGVFDKLSGALSEEVVNKTKAVYAFDVTGSDSGSWYVDLKNGQGRVGSGKDVQADVTFTLDDVNFHKLFEGSLKPTSAFMSGKLKISGDVGKAMKLEKLMGHLHSRGMHTSAARFNNESDIPLYTNVPQAFSRIEEVAVDADVRAKVNATYLFDIDGEGKYFIDLKKTGKVVQGDVEEKPDVSIKISGPNLIKLFNREMKPATAFMTGQLKLSGDLGKAMALENVLKAARGIKDYSTWARRRHFYDREQLVRSRNENTRKFSTSPSRIDEPQGWPLYSNEEEVFNRIVEVANEDFISDVQAIILFELEGIGQTYIDLKAGPKATISHERLQPPDLTIKAPKEVFMNIFNKEKTAGDAFIEGSLSVRGDLKVALKLEKFLLECRAREDAMI